LALKQLTLRIRFYSLQNESIGSEPYNAGRFAGGATPRYDELGQGIRHLMQLKRFLDRFLRVAGSAMEWRSVTVSLALLGLAGCATVLTASAPPEAKQKVVAERAEARWQALIKGDLNAAYTYLSEGSKATTPLAAYKANIKPGLWRGAKVDKVECEAEVCKVTMLITYDTPRMKGIETPLPESWIIEKGSAWYVYR